MAKTFEEYHRAFPKVYEKFKSVAYLAKNKGFKNYSAKGIFEIIRWEHGSLGTESEPLKLNNNFAPDYARKLMREDPLFFNGFFRIRQLRKSRIRI